MELLDGLVQGALEGEGGLEEHVGELDDEAHAGILFIRGEGEVNGGKIDMRIIEIR